LIALEFLLLFSLRQNEGDEFFLFQLKMMSNENYPYVDANAICFRKKNPRYVKNATYA